MVTNTTDPPRALLGVPMSVSDIYANARALSGYLAEKSAEIDAARRLPPEVAARVREAGMFRLTMPKAWGGPELSPAEQVEVIEELAKANVSTAWCVMIGCDSGFFAGYLDDAAGREIYPRLDMATAGAVVPTGRAERVDGGFRVTGQWAFGSGVSHADVVGLSCVIFEKGAPLAKPSGAPATCGLLAPAATVEIVDNWHTTGMRGTGSSDYRVKDLFVAERFNVDLMLPARRDGVLWRHHTNFLHKMSGVPLGAARAALDHVAGVLQHKVEMPGGRLYKNIGRLQSVVADAEMMLCAARSYVFFALEREWARLEKNEPPTVRERADAWLARLNASQAARDIIRMLYDAVGSAAIYSELSPLDRALRDAETFCQHITAQRKTLELVGAMLLNADAPLFPYL